MTEQEVRQEVRLQAAIGVDYIKLYVGLTPNLVKAAIGEAHHNGIKVIGHLYLTSWTDAANLGIDALTHGVPVSPYLLPKDKQRIFIENSLGPLVNHRVPVDPTLDIYEAMLKDDTKGRYLWPKVLQLTKI
jgi:hypothetical protein